MYTKLLRPDFADSPKKKALPFQFVLFFTYKIAVVSATVWSILEFANCVIFFAVG